jgi:competence protein ComEA
MKRNNFIYIAALAAALTANSALAQHQVTSNENTTNKTDKASMSKSRPHADAKKIDVNTASKEELQTIPGVDAATADAIIAARPIKSARELRNISGIDQNEFSQMLSHVRVSRSASEGGATATGGPAASSSGQASGSDKPTAQAQSKNVTLPASKDSAGSSASTSTESAHAGSDKPGAKEKEQSRAPKEKSSDKSASDQK